MSIRITGPPVPDRNCETCRYASSRVASARAGGPIKALCLNPDSPHFHEMTASHQSCQGWADGYKGAVDQLSGNPYDPNGWEP